MGHPTITFAVKIAVNREKGRGIDTPGCFTFRAVMRFFRVSREGLEPSTS
jgi:hypothetical protein